AGCPGDVTPGRHPANSIASKLIRSVAVQTSMASIPEDAIHRQPETAEPPSPRLVRRVVYRHTLPLRIMHWINAICLLILLGSGLQIFNAHPAQYGGQRSTFERPCLGLGDTQSHDGKLHGVTHLGSRRSDSTGWFGVAKVDGQATVRGWPAWATNPGP